MTKLSTQDVEHIAKLARLKLTPEEVTKMADQLSSILEYVDVLSEIDTTNVEPTAQVTGLTTVLREDIVDQTKADPDDLLACSGLPIVDHQIKAPHAHG